MNIIFFSNPEFFGDQSRPHFSSMPRFTRMLAEGMQNRGHKVEVWSPRSSLFRIPAPGPVKKWMGYADQYLLFPAEIRRRFKECAPDTLFVFTDQAQGPWVPMAAGRHHVIHCHDFLAQWSAMGKIAENRTSWTGRRYQSLIRQGYSHGKHFISVSQNTRKELHLLLPESPLSSSVVYNGLNSCFRPCNPLNARKTLEDTARLDLTEGYLLHVGGNQWYKNRPGVVRIYNTWRSLYKTKLPLLLIGEPPAPSLLKMIEESPFRADIHMLSGMEDELVRMAYAGASVFIFPSLAEGFGWPLAEAMASGCLTVTTDEAPMTEVAGKAGFFIPRMPAEDVLKAHWAAEVAAIVNKALNLDQAERRAAVAASLKNVKRFDPVRSLDRIEAIYQHIISNYPVL